MGLACSDTIPGYCPGLQVCRTEGIPETETLPLQLIALDGFFSVINLSNCSLNLCELLACTASCGSVHPRFNYALCKDLLSLETVT